jgi:hypothetical protein
LVVEVAGVVVVEVLVEAVAGVFTEVEEAGAISVGQGALRTAVEVEPRLGVVLAVVEAVVEVITLRTTKVVPPSVSVTPRTVPVYRLQDFG